MACFGTVRRPSASLMEFKEFFDKAESFVPEEVLTQIVEQEKIGIWRKKDSLHGEMIFEFGNRFYRVETKLLDIKDYESVFFKKGQTYKIAGAGWYKRIAFAQILNWSDFKESTISSMLEFLLAGNTTLTLKRCQLIVHHGAAPTNIFVFDEKLGVVKGFATVDSDVVELDRNTFDLVAHKTFVATANQFKNLSFGKILQVRIWHSDSAKDDSRQLTTQLLNNIKFEMADLRDTIKSPLIDFNAFLLSKSMANHLISAHADSASMLSLPDIGGGFTHYFGVSIDDAKLKEIIEHNPLLFTSREDVGTYGLQSSILQYAHSHGWTSNQETVVGEAIERAKQRNRVKSATQKSIQDSDNLPIQIEETDSKILPEQQRLSALTEKKAHDAVSDGGIMSQESPPTEDSNAEKDAIINFWKALRYAGWNYALRDIVRFHTSVRCEPLTILGGAPGSGKSSLARMYAEYFSLGNTAQFLSIDIQPSWHDRMDFLGFVKTHGDKPEFVDAETGVAQFLRDAKAIPNGLWLACLEEINLARPEHYFADFLQRVSLDDEARAQTPIEFKGLPEEEAYKGSFTLVPSVRFVGTCNFDETTQNFSARFLDRCNYIEFQPQSFLNAFFPANGKPPKLIKVDSDAKSKWTWHPLGTLSRMRIGAAKNEITTLIDNCEESLKTLGILPSPRVVSSMIRYIEARIDSVEDELADEHGRANTEQDSNAKNSQKNSDNKGTSIESTTVLQRAVDEAFAQRILSKLSTSRGCYPGTGAKTTLEDLRGKLKLNDVLLSLCLDMIEQYIRQFNTIMNG